jgi:hypothetical protein
LEETGRILQSKKQPVEQIQSECSDKNPKSISKKENTEPDYI